MITLNEYKKNIYYSSASPMSFDEFIETEVNDRENYNIEDVMIWDKKYNLTGNNVIWVSPSPIVAARYLEHADKWGDFENIYNADTDKYLSQLNTYINNTDGIIIPESDDGDDGYLMVLKTDKVLEKNKNTVYEYGCIMTYVKDVNFIKVKDTDLYNNKDGQYGLETEPHITILYGLHSDEIDDNDVINLFSLINIDDIYITGIGKFDNDNYSVLKYDIESDSLHILNDITKKLFPNTQSFPDYKPHMTIAYMLPGMADKYLKTYKNKRKVEFDYIVYSKPDGTKIKITNG